jgi:sialate O-acetylesterase
MVVITDLGNSTDIHPVNKQEVGRRLATWATAEVYQGRQLLPADRTVDGSAAPGTSTANAPTDGLPTLEPIVYSGPLFQRAVVQNNRIVVEFLAGQGLKSVDGKPLREFSIAGEDQVFHPAVADIDADRVVVSSELVPTPIAVRYCWRDTPSPNLVNGVGLPASPFRSDNFALVPAQTQ